MIFRQIETHYHLMMLSICDLGTFVFNFLVRLHPSLKGKKLEKLLEDWRVPISKSAFPTVIEAFLKFLEYIKICGVQAAKEYFCCSHQSSCCCSNLIWAFFFRPDIKICKAGKVIFGQDKFCSLIIVKSCGWLLENCKRVQQCVNVLLYDLKGRKKMMMKFYALCCAI